MTTRVFLVDDHRLIRDGIRLVIEQETDMKLVGDADNGRSALAQIAKVAPDVVVMDISMPGLNGIETTRTIRGSNPNTKVLAMSMYCEKGYVLDMLDAGAAGFVPKSDGGEELIRGIRAVARGQRYLSPQVAGFVIDNRLNPAPGASHGSAMGLLSPREREVLQLLAEGMSSKEIAGTLNISTRTVDAHRRGIMGTLNLHTIAELTKFAVRSGVTPLES